MKYISLKKKTEQPLPKISKRFSLERCNVGRELSRGRAMSHVKANLRTFLDCLL
jgi:hypothetical protein